MRFKIVSIIWGTVIVLFCSQSILAQQTVTLDTEPFQSSSGHWYHIPDEGNVINPMKQQKRYKFSEITKIADNILLYQHDNGGWPKNYDMLAILTDEQVKAVIADKHSAHTTFDNSTTYSQIEYLAKVFTITKEEKYKTACTKGIDFVFAAQYPNGGFPQFYPLEKGYSRHITFNDDAYIGVMNLLKMIVDKDTNFLFVDEVRYKKAKAAMEKGIDCILKCQIIDNDTLTAWCQQHDEKTLKPAWARKYEMPSISNAESCGIVLFLMKIENPSPAIIKSVQAAVAWFERSKLTGIRIQEIKAENTSTNGKKYTRDKVVVKDENAPPIWSRYSELKTHRPLFSDRSSKMLYSLAEVDVERRLGYAWYIDRPQSVLKKYPAWKKKWCDNDK